MRTPVFLVGILALLATSSGWAMSLARPLPSQPVLLPSQNEALDTAVNYAKKQLTQENLLPADKTVIARNFALLSIQKRPIPQSTQTVWSVDVYEAPEGSPLGTIVLNCEEDWFKHDKYGYIAEDFCDVTSDTLK